MARVLEFTAHWERIRQMVSGRGLGATPGSSHGPATAAAQENPENRLVGPDRDRIPLRRIIHASRWSEDKHSTRLDAPLDHPLPRDRDDHPLRPGPSVANQEEVCQREPASRGPTNHCSCGFLGHPERPCECDPGRVVRYRSRVSGPLRDRIDLHIDVPPVPVEALRDPGRGLSSAEVAARVQEARARQARRYRGRSRERVNARIEAAELQRWVDPGEDGWALLEAASRHMTLSPRSVHRVGLSAATVEP